MGMIQWAKQHPGRSAVIALAGAVLAQIWLGAGQSPDTSGSPPTPAGEQQPATPPPAPPAPPATPRPKRWYFARFGAEPCVPIDDVDFIANKRLYYGGGDLHTPQQVEAAFEGVGFQVKNVREKPDVVFFDATGIDGKTILVALFDDKQLCQDSMSGLEP
jgi:hypothetical protein